MGDFKELGVGLADARLLIENFKSTIRATELADLVSAVRKGENKPEGARKVKDINVDLSWYDWCKKTRKFMCVRLSNGGGCRKKRFDRFTKLSEVFEFAKDLYFPGGKCHTKRLSFLNTSLCTGDNNVITDLTISIDECLEIKSLRTAKFYLRTKECDPFGDINSDDENSSSSEFDVDISELDCFKTNLSPIANNDNKSSSPKSTKSKKKRTERDILVEQQNVEFSASLKIDQAKEQSKQEQSKKDNLKSSYLLQRQMYKKSLVPPEPNLTDDAVLVVIHHTTLGRTQRFFFSNDTCENVYNWVGSLNPEPEFFSLCSGSPTNVISPASLVSTVDRTVLLMHPVEDSNLTMDIIDQRQFTGENSKTSLPKKVPELMCPVCGLKQPVDEIESHASECAEQKYTQIIDEDDSDGEEIPPKHLDLIQHEENIETHDDLIERIQNALKPVNFGKTSLKIRVRRNHCFMDFVQKFKNAWIRDRIGENLFIEYIGEVGVDEGGPKREFFSGI